MTKSARHQKDSFLDALWDRCNVMKAIILRDLRTRFFNHGLGFLIVPLWPLAHMVILLIIYSLSGRSVPFGDSLNLFFATGLIPTLAFMYISRFMSLSIVLNSPMLAFPAVTTVDIMAARAFLEIVGGYLTLICIFTILTILGDNPIPYDIEQAVYAYLATVLLAIGVGSLVSVIVMFVPFFVTIYALFLIVVYIASGTLFIVSALPDEISYTLSWNPVVHSVEWMRSAFYPTYSTKILDKQYLLGFGLGSLCLGLTLERTLRWKVLEG